MDTLTSSQLGNILYDFCLKSITSFWESDNQHKYNELYEQIEKEKEKYKGEIDKKENLLLYIWAIFDLLNCYGKKYEKVTHYIFGEYLAERCNDKCEKDEEMKLVEKRFNEYRNIFRDQTGKIKNDYFVVVGQAMGHMEGHEGPSTKLYLTTYINIHLNHFIKVFPDLLKEIEIKDD